MSLPSCFKAYDIRGRVPEELNEDLAHRVGRAFVLHTSAKTVCVGRDVRPSSLPLLQALVRGLTAQGADVFDIGLCGTEEVNFANFSQGFDGGIMITASHNPPEYNGFKFSGKEAEPIGIETGLMDIGNLAINSNFPQVEKYGQYRLANFRDQYAAFLIQLVDVAALRPLKVVTNAGNGCAGLVLNALEKDLPFEFVKLHHKPDGKFPSGVPNPLLEENRQTTITAILEHGADFGVAWDGDFDRCFLFDETGEFIDAYYLVGLIAQMLLQKNPGENIVYDWTLTWNIQDSVARAGGIAVQSRAGPSFMKQVMSECNAIYGGETSAHHYFRDFAYCDNGNIPWLLIAELMSKTGKSLSTLVRDRFNMYPVSGELNVELKNSTEALAIVERRYSRESLRVSYTGGLSMEFEQWRFNLRESNTEPVVRLNVESRADKQLVKDKANEILELIESI